MGDSVVPHTPVLQDFKQLDMVTQRGVQTLPSSPRDQPANVPQLGESSLATVSVHVSGEWSMFVCVCMCMCQVSGRCLCVCVHVHVSDEWSMCVCVRVCACQVSGWSVCVSGEWLVCACAHIMHAFFGK